MNVWIDYADPWGAEQLARLYAEAAGWTVTSEPETYEVADSRLRDDEERAAYDEARETGYSLHFFVWPKDAPDAHEQY